MEGKLIKQCHSLSYLAATLGLSHSVSKAHRLACKYTLNTVVMLSDSKVEAVAQHLL